MLAMRWSWMRAALARVPRDASITRPPSRRVIDGVQAFNPARSVPAVAAGKFDLRHDDIRRTRLEQIVQIAPALEDGLDLVRVADCTREGFGDQKMVVAEPQGRVFTMQPVNDSSSWARLDAGRHVPRHAARDRVYRILASTLRIHSSPRRTERVTSFLAQAVCSVAAPSMLRA